MQVRLLKNKIKKIIYKIIRIYKIMWYFIKEINKMMRKIYRKYNQIYMKNRNKFQNQKSKLWKEKMKFRFQKY